MSCKQYLSLNNLERTNTEIALIFFLTAKIAMRTNIMLLNFRRLTHAYIHYRPYNTFNLKGGTAMDAVILGDGKVQLSSQLVQSRSIITANS